MRNTIVCPFLVLLSLATPSLFGQSKFANLAPVKFSQVQITDAFWKPRIDKIAEVTVPVCIQQT
ncbi:hypothetical protein, partial [Haliscomenobacter sp.]|uniref:hypothetical protein n=1 Tax=Haliscomenobacter sp. TaxID=2717303 RepID=UPI003364E0A3